MENLFVFLAITAEGALFFFQGGDIAKGNGEFAQLVLYIFLVLFLPGKKAAIPLPTSMAFFIFLCSLIN